MSNNFIVKSTKTLKKKIIKTYNVFVIFLKNNKNFYKNRLDAFISLELILVLGLLTYVTQKIIFFVKHWLNKLYIVNTVFAVIYSYSQCPMQISTSIENIRIYNKEKQLIIEEKNKQYINDIYFFLKTQEDLKNFNIEINDTKIHINEIKSQNDEK